MFADKFFVIPLLVFCLFLFIYIIFFSFFFFFSSRRRHTRSLRDWSSDVCSSDLRFPACVARSEGLPRSQIPFLLAPAGRGSHNIVPCERGRCAAAAPAVRARRSEERRVGKECRSRWAAER